MAIILRKGADMVSGGLFIKDPGPLVMTIAACC